MRNTSVGIALLLAASVVTGCHSSLPRPCPPCQGFENCMADAVDHVGIATPVSNQSRSHRVTRHYHGSEHAQDKKYYRGIWGTLLLWRGWY